MASGGSDLSTRMSAKDYRLACEIALKHFKERKVEISYAIKAPFPFLGSLHDHGLITSEIYKKSKKTCEDLSTVPEVVYDILTELEEKYHLSLLEILFNKVIMKKYPDLNDICEGFRDVILKKVCDKANVKKESAKNAVTQLSLEQALPSAVVNDNDALESQQANEQRAQVSEPAGKWEAQARSDGNQKPDIVEISSDDSAECRNREERPKASTSKLKTKPGFTDLGNKSALQKPKRRRARQQPGVSVNFRAQILPVTCGEITGLLIKRKLEQGATRKCIRTEDGNWLTPREFEVRGGYEKASNWKTSLTCGGKTLKRLMELRFLRPPPFRKGKKENSDKCKICQDGGKLFRCEKCQSFFHGDCHLPPVQTKRNSWNCTFCKIKNSSGCQKRYRKPEVLVKPMRPEEKSKCEFLLLKVYYHLESNVFPSIPHENYVRKASQYVVKLRKLDIIKKKLIKGNYPKVKDFVWAMNNFFWDPRRIYSYLSKKEFMKDFKEIFAIRETN